MKARARNKSNGETVFRTSGNSEKYHPRERRMRRNGRATRGAHRGALAYLLSSYAVRYARVRPANSCKALSCWRRAYVSPLLTIPTSLQIYVSFIARDSRRDSSTWSNYRAFHWSSTGKRPCPIIIAIVCSSRATTNNLCANGTYTRLESAINRLSSLPKP